MTSEIKQIKRIFSPDGRCSPGDCTEGNREQGSASELGLILILSPFLPPLLPCAFGNRNYFLFFRPFCLQKGKTLFLWTPRIPSPLRVLGEILLLGMELCLEQRNTNVDVTMRINEVWY